MSTELAPYVAPAVALAVPAPVFTGEQMAGALVAYRELQAALDRSMPDQIMTIGDRAFRKKGYWRAVRVAFNLSVEPIEERRDVAGQFDDGRDNFGYLVTYRATASTGVSVTGDGACFAVEKSGRFKCPHPHPTWAGKSEHFPPEQCPDFDPGFAWHDLPGQATEHNVRSHAHTRAFNRAVSNLVGFGEVSAEEIDRDDDDDRVAQPRRSTSTTSRMSPTAPGTISEPQQKRLYAIANGAGWSTDDVKAFLKSKGFDHTADVTRAAYDGICDTLKRGTGGPA